MSGHSKWSTIKRKKEATDAARGKLFSKLARAISIAAKSGGGTNPDSNSTLRMAIDQAKASNMPKANIERALQKAEEKGEDVEEVTYEGFGPNGISVIAEVATDNRNRTGQEIKNLFERGGGSLAGPGAVSFNFERKGLLLVEKEKDVEEQILNLIDVENVEDVEETPDGIEVYVSPDTLVQTREKIEDSGFDVKSSEFLERPKSLVTIEDGKQAEKALSFLDEVNEHDDVQKVFANLDVPDDTLKSLSKTT
jgi:YebC/PmpR family DNA-binding regulatory protein